MQYKGLQEIDLKLGLLSGSDIKIDNLVIKPYTLREIKDYGYTNYMENLQWISISIDDFIASINDVNKKQILEEQRANLKTFDFYSKLGGVEMLYSLINSMKMIFRTDDIKILDEGVLAINFEKKGVIYYDEDDNQQVDNEFLDMLTEDEITLIHRDNFDDIVEVVKLQNYLTKSKIEKSRESNPVDEETRKLLEDMERHRKRVEAKKKAQQHQEGQDIDISDIVSAVSSKSNSINKLNIWDLTLYQIYDEYSRLELIDNYDFSIRAMMAGADKVDLKHWSSKL